MQPVYKHIPLHLQTAVMACLEKYLKQASLLLQTQFSKPKVTYKKKGTIAGSAYLTRWEIQLNVTMLCENGHVFIDEVIPHELAHLLTFQQFGRVKPHGKEWQYMMSVVLGQLPKTTHRFSVHKANSYHYVCLCQEHYLTQIRHNKVQKQRTQYMCKKCGELLKFKNPHQIE